jgi:polyhydroxyalkanoate synthesis repressor PhaR
MTLIKRYSNRKLYDTERKRYITLDGIAVLIRQGEDVTVVDNDSGDDLTNQVLSQIILEQEKQKAGYLPKSILTALVKAGDSTVEGLRKMMNDSVESIRQVDLEIEDRIESLVNRGELAVEDAQELRKTLIDKASSLRSKSLISKAEIEKALANLEVPTREEVQSIGKQIDELNAKIDGLISK